MSGQVALRSEPAPVVACTVARDVARFGGLIAAMQAELGSGWGYLPLDEASGFLSQPAARALEFIVLALDAEDLDDLDILGEIVIAARLAGAKVILVAEGVSPAALHHLLKLGADDYLPYPLNDAALPRAIARLNAPPEIAPETAQGAGRRQSTAAAPGRRTRGPGALFAVQNLAGGTGASTLAVNLAWEMAIVDRKHPHSVCLIDLDLQFGSVATYLDLPRRDGVTPFLQDAPNMDPDAFRQSLIDYGSKMQVFTAPPEILPLDLVGPEEIAAILSLARDTFDIVIVDMPRTLTVWTETVLLACDVYFATLELDLRSAQDALRVIKALRAEDLPLEKLRFVLNRAPRFTDLAGKGRARRLAESLGVEIAAHLPDGGKAVMASGDNGQPLAETSRKNPLRREIEALAKGLHDTLLTASQSA